MSCSVFLVAGMNTLAYKVHSASSHACNFHPDNILVDAPSNHCSRWTTTTLGEQSITLELESPSVLREWHRARFHATWGGTDVDGRGHHLWQMPQE